MTTLSPSFVIVDFETTGLEPHIHIPLELGMLVVDNDLNILAEHSMLIQPAVDPIWEELSEKVQKMHTDNGLRAALENGDGYSIFTVEEAFVQFLQEFDATGLPMCGNTVSFDRGWMAVHMATVEDQFHYRNIDISSIKELCRRYNPKVFAAAPPKLEQHRSLPDCYETKDELDFYLTEFLMVDPSAV